MNDELISFVDEPALDDSETTPTSSSDRWPVLIVDDDEDVHEATTFALRGEKIHGRPLAFHHAYSGAEALEKLATMKDVAAILLDVVMETEDAGLRTVEAIREDLGLRNTRIILRTGQPGYAPELEAIRRYDINDYKTKSELTQNKLYIALTTAIRSYDQLRRLEASRHGLEQIVAASNQFIAEKGMQTFAEGVITQIAGFLGIDPEGVVCASLGQNGTDSAEDRYTVIAAAGNFRHLISRNLHQINDPEIAKRLTQCLIEGRTAIDARSLTLFFPGHDGHDFAAYVASSTPLQEVDRELLEVFCTNIALCGANVELVSELREAAFVDRQLGIPNRTSFIETLDGDLGRSKAEDKAVGLIDIDQFAETNDMLGHAYGDLLLRAVGERLQDGLGTRGTVARVSGDGFGVYGDADSVSPEVLAPLFEAPFDIQGIDHPVSVSMGFVHAGDFADGGTGILKNASIALKHAKQGGQGQTAYFSTEMSNRTRDRTRLLHDLRLDFDDNRLFLVYQPQVDLLSGSVVGVEALLRWRRADGEFISPDRFIPVAEGSGLIVPIGAWVLRTALADLARLRTAGHPDLRMSVNVSAIQFRHPQLLDTVDKALRDTHVDPSNLELEITESVAMMGFDHINRVLRNVKDRQIAVAIDDFGTGFSSLAYLDRLPADRLKIDRVFVTALDAEVPGARIAEMVIPLGRSLGMKVLAEGVENELQVNRLTDLHCDEMQGYFHARPMPFDQLLSWLPKTERPKIEQQVG